mgnify:CR=1
MERGLLLCDAAMGLDRQTVVLASTVRVLPPVAVFSTQHAMAMAVWLWQSKALSVWLIVMVLCQRRRLWPATPAI